MLHALGNYRPYGVAFLVVGLFVSPAYALFDDNDKNNLYHIYEHVNSLDIFSMWYQDWIDDRENAIDTSLSDIHNMRNWLFGQYTYDGDPLADIVNDSRDALEDIRFILEPFTNTVVSRSSPFDSLRTAQVAVTNIAETYWLEKIYDVLTIGGAGYTVYSPYIYSRDGVTTYNKAIQQLIAGISEWENGVIDDATFFNRYGAWLDRVHDFASHIDYNLLSSLDQRSAYLDVLSRFGPSLGPAPRRRFLESYAGISSLYQSQYGTYLLTSNSIAQSAYTINNGGLSANIFTNLVTSDGSIKDTDNAFTNSSSVFGKFANSFLPSGMFNPDEVNTNLFTYVDSDISETPSFNPIDISPNRSSRSSSSDFDYDFDDSSGDFDYNLINPLKTATDTVQHDTDLDNKFEQLAGLVNQRITSIFQNPLNSISGQPARWQATLIDKDLNETEDYVDPQYSKSSDGVQFVCWVCESMMFFSFFCFCVRRSLKVQQGRDVASAS